MSDLNKCCRQKYWSEVEDSERIVRLRSQVKRLIQRVDMLEKILQILSCHQHAPDGKMFVPIEKGYENINVRACHDGDDVCF